MTRKPIDIRAITYWEKFQQLSNKVYILFAFNCYLRSIIIQRGLYYHLSLNWSFII